MKSAKIRIAWGLGLGTGKSIQVKAEDATEEELKNLMDKAKEIAESPRGGQR